MARPKYVVPESDPKLPRSGTINAPDTYLMHCICRVWRTDWETQVKFPVTRILVNALVDIEVEKRLKKKSWV